MQDLMQVMVSGLTLAAMYALSAVGLSLCWGSLNVLNMAHGAIMVVGGYVCYSAASMLGWGGLPSFTMALLAGAALGALLYLVLVRPLRRRKGFETLIIIASFGLGLVIENLVLKIYGAYPIPQPITVEGGWAFDQVFVPYQNMIVLASSSLILVVLALFMGKTRSGRAIRATSLSAPAAQLQGVPVRRIYLLVMMLSGALAAASGVLLSTLTTLAPTMGYDPMLKAFIVCVAAGLGNASGALVVALVLGLFEAAVGFYLGVRFGFSLLLALVILSLIWRPSGLFGSKDLQRL